LVLPQSNGSPSNSESAFLLLRLHQIIERLDSFHPDIEPAPSAAGRLLRRDADIVPDIEETEYADPGGSSYVDEDQV
jgi:hypothetical protein